MQTLQLGIVAAFAIHAIAYPQIGISPTAASGALTTSDLHSLAHDIGPQASDRIIRNANECTPDVAAPVWGRNATLLGYSCSAANVNGE
jgi:hypothetical protein